MPLLLAAVVSLSGLLPGTAAADDPSGPPAAVAGPARVFKKQREVGGVGIVASDKVAVAAIDRVAGILASMTAERPELLAGLAGAEVRIAVLAPDEAVTDLPFRAALRPRRYHDIFRRAAGATPESPWINVGEENLMGWAGDPGSGENLTVREIGRSLFTLVLKSRPGFVERLERARAAALKRRAPGDIVPPPKIDAYWAEGVLARFDAGSRWNHEGFDREDPELGALVREVFGEGVRPLPAAVPDRRPGAPVFVRSPESLAWETRFGTGEETLAPPGITILAAYPAELHRSMRPGYIAEWRSPENPGPPTKIRFANASGSPVNVAWIDAQGKAVSGAELYPSEYRECDTTVGAIWRIADARTGKALSYAVAEDVSGLRLIKSAEEEDEEFEEDGEFESYTPVSLPLLPVTARTAWSSYESSSETTLCLVNEGSRTLVVEAVDRGGKCSPFDRLRPGDSIRFETFADRVWKVSDSGGRVLGYAVSSRHPSILTLRDGNGSDR